MGVFEQTMETITMKGDSVSVCCMCVRVCVCVCVCACACACIFSKQTRGDCGVQHVNLCVCRSRAEGKLRISANHLVLAPDHLLLWFLSETKGPYSIASTGP